MVYTGDMRICTFEGCEARLQAKGLCSGHWYQQHNGLPLKPIDRRAKQDKVCTFGGCKNLISGKGLCTGHLKQVVRGVALTTLIDQYRPLEERFWEKVDKNGPDGCWLWTATCRGPREYQYGSISLRGRMLSAHRVSWELAGNALVEGLVIDHMCHTRRCVNPAHLQQVTPKQNMENLDGLQSNNSSGYRGVTFVKRLGKYKATVGHNKKLLYLGLFDNIEDAARAVKEKRNELFTNNLEDRK